MLISGYWVHVDVPKPVQIKRQDVYDAIKRAKGPVTSGQIAAVLGVNESAVRAAIGWLCLGGFLKEAGFASRHTKPNKRGWRVMYRVKQYTYTQREFSLEAGNVHTKGIHCERDRELELSRGKFNADLSFLDQYLFGRMKAK